MRARRRAQLALCALLPLVLPALSRACQADGSEACAASGTLTRNGWVRTKDPAAACAPPPARCRRPCGVVHHYFKSAAGLLVAAAYLQPHFPKANITWIESMTLADARSADALTRARARGEPATTALRHPVHRLVSHFFQTVDTPDAPTTAGRPPSAALGRDFATWVARNSARAPRRGNDGRTKLWIELDNVYVKAFSAWDGKAAAASGAPLGADALEAAKRTLAARYDHSAHRRGARG